jgi:hypothetical protein
MLLTICMRDSGSSLAAHQIVNERDKQSNNYEYATNRGIYQIAIMIVKAAPPAGMPKKGTVLQTVIRLSLDNKYCYYCYVVEPIIGMYA